MVTAEVTHAKSLAADLLHWESRGPGDTDNAMRRLARRYGIEYGALWSLRYRKPKRIWADVVTAIAAAHAAEVQRQQERLAHAATAAEAILGPDRASVRAAHALAGRAEGKTPALVDEERK